MMAAAALALLVNAAIMWGLNRDRHDDLNVRAAWIDMAGDAASSVALIGGAIAIRLTGWQQLDPLLSVAIAALIVWTAWDPIHESLNILLEGLPRGLELQQVTGALTTVTGVINVHDLHIWSLGSSAHALSCHVLIEDMPPSASESILKCINDVLCDFGIHHTTIQFEHVPAPSPMRDASCPVASRRTDTNDREMTTSHIELLKASVDSGPLSRWRTFIGRIEANEFR